VDIQSQKTAEINEAYSALKRTLGAYHSSPPSTPFYHSSPSTHTSPSTPFYPTPCSSPFSTPLTSDSPRTSSDDSPLLDRLFENLVSSFPEVVPSIDPTVYLVRLLKPDISISQALEIAKLYLCFYKYRTTLQHEKFFGLPNEEGWKELTKMSFQPIYHTLKNLEILENPTYSFPEKTSAYRELRGVTWVNKTSRLQEIWNTRGRAVADEDACHFSDMMSRDLAFTQADRDEFRKWNKYFTIKKGNF